MAVLSAKLVLSRPALGDQQLFDESEKPGRIVPQSRTAVKFLDEPRKPRQAIRIGIADLDDVAGKPEDRDRLPRRGAGAFGNKHPKRLSNMRGIGHIRHHSRLGCLCLSI